MKVNGHSEITFTIELNAVEAEAMELFIDTALDRARTASDPHALNTTAEQWLRQYRDAVERGRYG